jgi:hypothetical protein
MPHRVLLIKMCQVYVSYFIFRIVMNSESFMNSRNAMTVYKFFSAISERKGQKIKKRVKSVKVGYLKRDSNPAQTQLFIIVSTESFLIKWIIDRLWKLFTRTLQSQQNWILVIKCFGIPRVSQVMQIHFSSLKF